MKNTVLIPLLSCSVRAGFPSPADDYVEQRLNLHDYLVRRPAATFYMRAGADHPEARINKGDLLVVDRSLHPVPGRPVVAVAGGDLAIRLMPRHSSQALQVWGVVAFIIHPTAV